MHFVRTYSTVFSCPCYDRPEPQATIRADTLLAVARASSHTWPAVHRREPLPCLKTGTHRLGTGTHRLGTGTHRLGTGTHRLGCTMVGYTPTVNLLTTINPEILHHSCVYLSCSGGSRGRRRRPPILHRLVTNVLTCRPTPDGIT